VFNHRQATDDGPTYPTYIITILTYTSAIITLKLCALNVKNHHFILKFNKISLFCEYRERGVSRQTLQNLFIDTSQYPKMYKETRE
jgi:hypothetical protein